MVFATILITYNHNFDDVEGTRQFDAGVLTEKFMLRRGKKWRFGVKEPSATWKWD
jgi:hypothetical protein